MVGSHLCKINSKQILENVLKGDGNFYSNVKSVLLIFKFNLFLNFTYNKIHSGGIALLNFNICQSFLQITAVLCLNKVNSE